MAKEDSGGGMKFKHAEKIAPKVGDTRTVRKFLWWPKRLGNETRWLCFARWRETYKTWYSYRPMMGLSKYVPMGQVVGWVDQNKFVGSEKE